MSETLFSYGCVWCEVASVHPPLCERSIVAPPLLLFDSPATSQLGGPQALRPRLAMGLPLSQRTNVRVCPHYYRWAMNPQ